MTPDERLAQLQRLHPEIRYFMEKAYAAMLIEDRKNMNLWIRRAKIYKCYFRDLTIESQMKLKDDLEAAATLSQLDKISEKLWNDQALAEEEGLFD